MPGDMQQEQWDESTDVFDKLTVNTTFNESNLASHYRYNPERWRLFVGDTATSANRVFPEYNSVPQYNHAGDVHELIPGAGEKVIMQTAERFRYTVQYEMIATWAAAVNQELTGNDYVRIGYFDDTDGWFIEFNGGHRDKWCDLVCIRDGSEVYRKNKQVGRSIQYFTRLGLKTAWYNVTRQAWNQSFPEDVYETQKIFDIDEVAVDKGSRGPKTGNLNLRYEVNADANTTGLVMEAGSTALITKGGGERIKRHKSVYNSVSVDSTDVWYPVGAFRASPDNPNVNNQVNDVSALSYDSDTTVQLAVIAFDSSNVGFDGTDSWGTPNIWNPQNNALQYRNDVNAVVDNAGVSAAEPVNPGGMQLGLTVLSNANTQSKKGTTQSKQRIKRNIPNGDIAVVMVNAGATGNLGYDISFEEDW